MSIETTHSLTRETAERLLKNDLDNQRERISSLTDSELEKIIDHLPDDDFCNYVIVSQKALDKLKDSGPFVHYID